MVLARHWECQQSAIAHGMLGAGGPTKHGQLLCVAPNWVGSDNPPTQRKAMIMKVLVFSLFALVATTGIAFSQGAYVIDDDGYVELPGGYAEPRVVVGPRVYRWIAVPPDDCGTFKYWNGAYCADARFEPPREAHDD